MDKEWMHLPSRLVPEYEEGVQKFIAQDRLYAKTREVILCPCKKCKNKKYLKFDEVYDHLIIKGIDPSYTTWVFHGEIYNPQLQGEGSSRGVQVEENKNRDAYNLYRDSFVPNEEIGHTMTEARDNEFADLLEDAESPLFPGCTTYTKLSATVSLYNYKSTNGHTDHSFNELLKILGYEKIHACPNDCCLFRNEFMDLNSCPKCGSSRWKVDKFTAKIHKGVPEKGLMLRHNLDVMHVEKNVCENIIGTLLNVKKKSKDGINARKDLMDLQIKKELHPQEKGENTYHLPAAPYTLSKKEMDVFCSRLKKIKLPDGYSSNIGNCVSIADHKLIGLKSHDCHVLMQQLLSVALINLLPKGPRNALFRLSAFYNELCQRVLNRNRLEQLEESIAETLCMLERYFPPAFFTISVHLTIHLAREARLCGPVHFRWMYPFERFMKTLKGYVKNRARPEGCIAEGYLADERMRFCSAYIKKAASIGVRSNRNKDLENGLVEGRPISQGKEKILEDHVLQAAHRYVLFNTAEVESYLQMHIEELKKEDHRFLNNETLLQKQHMETFSQWFSKHARGNSSGRIQWLAHGPRKHVTSYTGYIINGHRFHTIDIERSTQDSGVSIEADTICQSSGNDYSHTVGRLSYYGVIREIILLDYYSFQVPFFRCDWANPGTGIKMEDCFTLVNLHQGIKTFESDPFILASQAKQVFYSRDNDESNWYVLLKAPPRGTNVNELEEVAYTPSIPLDVSQLEINITEKEPYSRNECEGIDVTET
ncbi:uncharacterized protein [Henckelia pumila]|uniref:uncharacterized protein n=1 Tax=Henckelia pumila TaxID=405737 RepID=UPI003C6E15B6